MGSALQPALRLRRGPAPLPQAQAGPCAAHGGSLRPGRALRLRAATWTCAGPARLLLRAWLRPATLPARHLLLLLLLLRRPRRARAPTLHGRLPCTPATVRAAPVTVERRPLPLLQRLLWTRAAAGRALLLLWRRPRARRTRTRTRTAGKAPYRLLLLLLRPSSRSATLIRLLKPSRPAALAWRRPAPVRAWVCRRLLPHRAGHRRAGWRKKLPLFALLEIRHG